ncbi:MAG: S49 family peptidase [Pseudomonadota bacterium]
MGLFRRKATIDPSSEHRDWQLVSAIAQSALAEQKKSRRWGIFFKSIMFLYIGLFLVGLFFQARVVAPTTNIKESHTAIISIDGTIADNQDANAGSIVSSLRRAFESTGSVAVMLIINSPGGTPVQAGYVHDEINRLQAQHPDKKVYAVFEDLAASGAYYIAAAADEIYADKASLVGSIGVTAAGFGFTELMDKIGVERRNFASGEHKAFLDPFLPLREDQQQFWASVLESTHEQFIRVVKEGRGDRLAENDELFTGLIWNGEQALELGLIDGLASPGKVAREIIQEETIRDYTLRPSPLEEFTRRFGVAIGEGVVKVLNSSVVSPLYLQ